MKRRYRKNSQMRTEDDTRGNQSQLKTGDWKKMIIFLGLFF